MLLFLLSTCTAVFAQEAATSGSNSKFFPKWVSKLGYWVVESNIKQRNESVVYFYNNAGQLVYQERLSGVKMKLNNRKVKLQLKQALDERVLAYQQNQQVGQDEAWVIAALETRHRNK